MDKKIDDKKMMYPPGPSLSVGWFEKAINAQGLQSLIVSTTGAIFLSSIFLSFFLSIHEYLARDNSSEFSRSGGNQDSGKMPPVLRTPTIVRKRL